MKLKMIAAACAALCSVGAFAAVTPTACNEAGTNADFVNTCAPEVVFYIAGASAQEPALKTIAATNGVIFDTSKKLVKVVNATASGKTAGNSWGYLGYSAAGKRVLFVYNKTNGSGAGVSLLATGKGPVGEENQLYTVSAADVKKGLKGTGVLNADGSVNVVTEADIGKTGAALGSKVVHLALVDVHPNELSPEALTADGKIIASKWKEASFPTTITGMQGFGVVVNAKFYDAMITAQAAAGQLPSGCVAGDRTAACQPNMPAAVYASIAAGKLQNAAEFLGAAADGSVFDLQRRVQYSGSQAASNIFFMNQGGYSAKAALNTFVSPIAATTGTTKVTLNVGTGNVIAGISANTTDYSLGVVSLEKKSSDLANGLFVKVDGFSPNFTKYADGSSDATNRAALIAGYPFAFEMVAAKQKDLASKYAVQNGFADNVIAALKDPSYNLTGVAYIGSADTGVTKNTVYTRAGNNYTPLRHK